MKITKFVHSCLLAETPERVALVDPGNWSWEAGVFDVDTIDRIDRIIVTHEHADHMHPPFIKAVLQKFPQAHVVANDAVTAAMKDAKIEATYRGNETQCAKPFESPHENLPIPGVVPPVQTGFHFLNQLTLPGDSHSFAETKEILALPVIAPWGSTVDAVSLALKLKPAHIIPVHDWHYTDEARAWLYGLLEHVFAKENIMFHPVVSGQSVEI